ncbi:MAG: hypothetical protein ACJARD_000446 [Alphaproteobacteria bacterium]|jgi:hypothetical protein
MQTGSTLRRTIERNTDGNRNGTSVQIKSNFAKVPIEVITADILPRLLDIKMQTPSGRIELIRDNYRLTPAITHNFANDPEREVRAALAKSSRPLTDNQIDAFVADPDCYVVKELIRSDRELTMPQIDTMININDQLVYIALINKRRLTTPQQIERVHAGGYNGQINEALLNNGYDFRVNTEATDACCTIS